MRGFLIIEWPDQIRLCSISHVTLRHGFSNLITSSLLQQSTSLLNGRESIQNLRMNGKLRTNERFVCNAQFEILMILCAPNNHS